MQVQMATNGLVSFHPSQTGTIQILYQTDAGGGGVIVSNPTSTTPTQLVQGAPAGGEHTTNR